MTVPGEAQPTPPTRFYLDLIVDIEHRIRPVSTNTAREKYASYSNRSTLSTLSAGVSTDDADFSPPDEVDTSHPYPSHHPTRTTTPVKSSLFL